MLAISGFVLWLTVPLAVASPVYVNGTGKPDVAPDTDLAESSIWQPEVGASWQIMLSQVPMVKGGKVSPDVDIYDVDLFDTPASTIADLKKAGKKVICYFSAGTYEEWRKDAADFPKSDLGKPMGDWPGETWVQIGSPAIRDIMKTRIKTASEKGCDAIDPDNVDGYDNENGIGLTEEATVDYVQFMAAEAAKYKMATGLKNAASIIEEVLPTVQFSVNEQCAAIGECEDFAQFITAGKPVFNVEYPLDDVDDLAALKRLSASQRKKFCTSSGQDKFSTVLKLMNLNAYVQFCDGTSATTAVDTTATIAHK